MEIITGCVDTYRKQHPKVFEVPFNSTNKYTITINESRAENGHCICMKCAPERILEKCSSIVCKGKEVPLDSSFKRRTKSWKVLGKEL